MWLLLRVTRLLRYGRIRMSFFAYLNIDEGKAETDE
jgi:hypothetical protein